MAAPTDFTVVVVEDSPEWIKVAKSVFDNEPINVVYASTYEDAMSKIEELKEKGIKFKVVTDLFFPSEINFVERLLPMVKENIEKEKAKIREMIEKAQGLPIARFYRGLLREFDEIPGEFEHLNENPSGLGIIDYCLNNKVPVLVLSQGNRHKGNLAIVRSAVGNPRILGTGLRLTDLLFRRDGVDKRDPAVWWDAVYGEEGLMKVSGSSLISVR